MMIHIDAVFIFSLFHNLCGDDTPMVRRAAAGKLGVSEFFANHLLCFCSVNKLADKVIVAEPILTMSELHMPQCIAFLK